MWYSSYSRFMNKAQNNPFLSVPSVSSVFQSIHTSSIIKDGQNNIFLNSKSKNKTPFEFELDFKFIDFTVSRSICFCF
jgi:hypothetical protein